jgi:hypothetical protein
MNDNKKPDAFDLSSWINGLRLEEYRRNGIEHLYQPIGGKP